MSIKTIDLALQLVDFHLDRVAEALPEESPVLKHLARAVIALCEARESVQELRAAGPGRDEPASGDNAGPNAEE